MLSKTAQDRLRYSQQHQNLAQHINNLLNPALSEKEADRACKQLVDYWTSVVPSPPGIDIDTVIEKSGTVLSPMAAGNCSHSYRRTRRYLTALYQAIMDISRHKSDGQAVNILYPGCGPYGTLVLPLLAIFTPDQIQLTLLDFNIASTNAVQQQLAYFQLEGFIQTIETCDALKYQVSTQLQPDIIISEIMLAGLMHEGHVAINRHLINQAPQAMLIPQSITLRLKLADPAIEFSQLDLQQRGLQRIDLGEIFVFSADIARDFPEINSNLPGKTVQLPDTLGQQLHPFLFTEIHLYAQQYLTEYEDGLTSPVIFPIEDEYLAGQKLNFSYKTGCYPGPALIQG